MNDGRERDAWAAVERAYARLNAARDAFLVAEPGGDPRRSPYVWRRRRALDAAVERWRGIVTPERPDAVELAR